jgi:hypothetical protein
MWLRADKRATLARRDTALVIEGYLRSGNTYSVAAFEAANGRAPHLGRHLHGAPHVLRAVRMGLPTVVLVRDPVDAVSSYLIRRPTLTPARAVTEYLDFYETAWPARHGFVVGLFDQVVNDFGAVLAMVNARFGTSFREFTTTPEAVQATMARVEELNRLECKGELVETHVGRPSSEREDRKSQVAALLHAPGDLRLRRLLDRAEASHEAYRDLASVQSRGLSGRGDGSPH